MEDLTEDAEDEVYVETCTHIEGKRWLEGGYQASNIAVITEEVVAITTKHLVKFLFLRSGKCRLYIPGEQSDGVSLITGRDDLAVLGWSERCVRPRVFVYQYNNPLELKTLTGQAAMEYKSLCFSHGKFLLAVSGVPDFIVNLWDWETETLLASVPTELDGPSSSNIKVITTSFPPDSGAGMSKTFATLWSGRISVWDIEKVSESYNIVKKTIDVENILSYTWCFPSDLYLLSSEAKIYRVDTSNIAVTQMETDETLLELLTRAEMKSCEFHLKAHFDGLILFAPKSVVILSVDQKKAVISTVSVASTDQTIINISEFFSSYKYIGWTHSGRLVSVSTTEKRASLETVLANDPWLKYNAACFVQKFLGFFVTIDKYQVLRVLDTNFKRQLWKRQINLEALSMISYPHLPAFILGTMDGRLLFFSLDLPTQQIDYEEAQEAAKLKVDVRYIGDILLHRHPVDNMKMDHKTSLCAAVSKEEGVVVVVDAKNLTKILYLDSVTVEGQVVDLHLLNKTLLILSTSSGCEEHYGDVITYVKVDQKKRTLTVANVFNLSCPCSGLAVSDNCKFFFSVLLTTKHLAKFSLSEEEQPGQVSAVCSVPSCHQLGLHSILTTDWGSLALLGRDGRLSFHSTDLSGQPQVVELHHYQAGGVIDANIASNGNILSVSEEGTLVLFQRKELLECPTEVDKSVISQMQKLRANDVGIDSVGRRGEEEELSWSEKKNKEWKEKERKKYEKEIKTITDTVETMAEQVGLLLRDNESLPEKDQLDRRQFELDVEEQGRQVAEGEDKVGDLKMDLRAWNLARQQVSIKVKKEVWDKMFVSGRSLVGIQTKTCVSNFPLHVMTEDEQRRLEDTKAERRVELTLLKETAELRGGPAQVSAANSGRSSVAQPASPSSRSVTPSSSNMAADRAAETQSNEDSRHELLGSRSYLYIDIDSALLVPQMEITTQKQSQQQVILLKDVVRRLKMFFNKRFDELFRDKEEAFEKITALNERLDSVLAELRLEEDILRPSWNADEKPEMDLPDDPQDLVDVKAEGSNSGRTSAGGGKDHHRKRAHMMSMESGSGKNNIPPPLFMKIKKPETFTDEEVAAAESYEAEVLRMIEKGHFRKRELEAEKNQLEVQIGEIVSEIDKKVLDLFWLRISVEKCVLSEELKMLSLNRDLGIRDRLTREEESIRLKLREAEEQYRNTKESLEDGVQLLEHMKKTHKEKLDQDKFMDKNFKKEFPGLGFHQVDSLYKLFKKRPKAAERLEKSADSWAQQKHDTRKESKISVGSGSGTKLGSEQLKTKTVQAALARMSNMFMGTLTIKGPKTSTAIGMSLEEMDRPVHCPENIDRTSWLTMCKLRREKIAMEDFLRSLAKEVAEAEIIVEQRRETHCVIETRIVEMRKHQEDFLQSKAELINNRQIQLMMKRGQVEVELDIMEPVAKDCMIITDSVIDKLNDDIVRLGEAKIQAMQESKEYRKGSLHLR